MNSALLSRFDLVSGGVSECVYVCDSLRFQFSNTRLQVFILLDKPDEVSGISTALHLSCSILSSGDGLYSLRTRHVPSLETTKQVYSQL